MSYDRQAQGALRTLKAKGVALVMSRRLGAHHDPVTQTTTGAAPTTQDIQAVILPASDGVFGDASFQRGLIGKNQRKLLVAGKAPDGVALAFEPATGYTVEFEGQKWTMQAIARLAPDGGDPIIFTVEVTR